MENQIHIMYTFLNLYFFTTFIVTSAIYVVSTLLVILIRVKKIPNKIDYSIYYNNSVLKYYLLSIIWIIAKYL